MLLRGLHFCISRLIPHSIPPGYPSSSKQNPDTYQSVIRRLVIVIMNRRIRTPTRRLIQIIPQIDIHLLSRTHIPSTRIRPRDPTHSPLQSIPRERECTIGILLRAETHRQTITIDDFLGIHDSVQKLGRFARCANKFHELARYDLELAGGGVVAQECGASAVEWRGLHVFVEIGCFYGADPVVPCLESFAWTGSCGCAAIAAATC